MASFKCTDIGMTDNFEVKDENEEELMKIIALHASTTHGMRDVPPDTLEKIKAAIKK